MKKHLTVESIIKFKEDYENLDCEYQFDFDMSLTEKEHKVFYTYLIQDFIYNFKVFNNVRRKFYYFKSVIEKYKGEKNMKISTKTGSVIACGILCDNKKTFNLSSRNGKEFKKVNFSIVWGEEISEKTGTLEKAFLQCSAMGMLAEQILQLPPKTRILIAGTLAKPYINKDGETVTPDSIDVEFVTCQLLPNQKKVAKEYEAKQKEVKKEVDSISKSPQVEADPFASLGGSYGTNHDGNDENLPF